jgi:adenylate kinase
VVPGARLVILGKQGAGKGTQCVRLARHYVVPHISTGDIFRAAVRAGTEYGEKVRSFMEVGELIPDEIVNGVVAERLLQGDTAHRGFILDGYPRSAGQAKALSENLHPQDIDLAIDLEVPTDIVMHRLASRRVCSTCNTNYSTDKPPNYDWSCDFCGGDVVQRDDDREDAIRRRLSLYEVETEPLIVWYLERDKLVQIDGTGSPDSVFNRVVRAIDRRREHAVHHQHQPHADERPSLGGQGPSGPATEEPRAGSEA